MLSIIYGAILIFLTAISISLLFYLTYCLVTYLYTETPLLVHLFKEYRNLRKAEKDFIKYYKNTFK